MTDDELKELAKDWSISMSASRAELLINAWTTECGDCGYGRGGWAASPAFKGLPVLVPGSRVCPGCGVRFTHSLNLYTGEKILLRDTPAGTGSDLIEAS